MTIERLAQAPLVLPDASYGAEDPTRRQLAELAQRAGVRDRAARSTSRTASGAASSSRAGSATRRLAAACCWNLGDRAAARRRLGAVRRAALRHLRLRLAPRRPALAGGARVRRRSPRSACWRRTSRAPRSACRAAATPQRPTTMLAQWPMSTVAEEEYLQTLFWLHEAGLPMTGANVARAMQLSPPTVHEMIGRLERDGYITRARATRRSRSPTSGREHAEGIVRRHRLIERFLTDVLGIPWDEVHEEAERLEHAMSPVLEERMLAAIGDAKTCPHGHPIDAGTRIEGVAARRRRGRRERDASCASRTRPRTCCTTSRRPASSPGMEGTLAERDDDEVVVDAADGRRVARHAQRRRDRVGHRRPVAAAARRAARAARARARPLRPLS